MDRRGQIFPLRDINPVTTTPFINWVLIGINVLAFLLSLAAFELILFTYGFIPAEPSLLDLFTSMFLHGGIAHLFGNMWFLYIFGDNVEDALGHGWYAGFYLAAGIVALLAHWAVSIGSVIPTVGASGAISGVLGAYLVLFPKAEVYASGGFHVGRISAKVMLLLWFAYQFILGTLGLFGSESNVAFWAHIGGFIFGVLFAWGWRTMKGE